MTERFTKEQKLAWDCWVNAGNFEKQTHDDRLELALALVGDENTATVKYFLRLIHLAQIVVDEATQIAKDARGDDDDVEIAPDYETVEEMIKEGVSEAIADFAWKICNRG